MTRGYREFEFDLPKALLDHLIATIDGMESAPFGRDQLAAIPEAQGVYRLFLDGELVYIGKTDADAGLNRRLWRHYRKTFHRKGLWPDRVSFKAVRIYVFTAIDLEAQLIKHYAGGSGVSWNGSGFGANDPGRERDTSRPSRFDRDYPIDLDVAFEVALGGTRTAAEVLSLIKAALPYVLRFQSSGTRSRAPHPELMATNVTLPDRFYTAREVLALVTAQLPPGWQATALSALLILYRESVETYPGAIVIARS